MPLGEFASFCIIVYFDDYYSNRLSYFNRKISHVFEIIMSLLKKMQGINCLYIQSSNENADNSLVFFNQNENNESSGDKNQPSRKATSGIYIIRNTKTDAVYVGEFNKKRGSSARFTEHRSRLRKNNGVNLNLQAAWNLYGEECFEFRILEQSPELDDNKKRKNRETEIIMTYVASNTIVYNRYAGKIDLAPCCSIAEYKANLKHQTPEFRQKISEANKGRANSNRQAIWINGDVFLSYTEAEQNSHSKKITRATIRKHVNDPKNSSYRKATSEEIMQEEKRRTSGPSGASPPTLFFEPKKRSGVSQKIWVNGTTYNSMSDAAKAEQISPQAISGKLKRGTSGYYYLNDENECFTKDKEGNVIIIKKL